MDKLDEIEALARDGETDAASILALIACVRCDDAIHAMDDPDPEDFAAALEARRAARSQLEQSP